MTNKEKFLTGMRFTNKNQEIFFYDACGPMLERITDVKRKKIDYMGAVEIRLHTFRLYHWGVFELHKEIISYKSLQFIEDDKSTKALDDFLEYGILDTEE